MAGQKKEAALSALSVVVVGGSFEQRRAVGQMVFGGLQLMRGGLFNPQVNCADALKCHVTSGDLAEISGRSVDAIRLQLAAHGTFMADTIDAIDAFKPDQSDFAQPMDVAPYVAPTVAQRNLERALANKPERGVGIRVGDREYSMEEFTALVEEGNFSETHLKAMESLLNFAEIVARIRKAIHPKEETAQYPASEHFSLSVREDHDLDGAGKPFEEATKLDDLIASLDKPEGNANV